MAENNLSQILNEYLQELDFKIQHPHTLMGLATGFDNLDTRLGGLRSGEVILIGARPAMGKTSFSLNIAYNMASNFYLQKQQKTEDDKCVVYINLELAKKFFTERLLSIVSGVMMYQMQNNEDIWENFNKIADTVRQLEKLPLYLCDAECSVESILAELQKIRQQKEIGCVIIDYLQLLSREYPEKEEDLTGVMAEIKNMAVAFKVPVIVLTQLSRNLEKRANKIPLLSDIRGLYNNLNAVDKVLFLFRENYYIHYDEPRRRRNETPEKFEKRHKQWEKRDKETENLCDIIVAKNNHGYYGYVEMYFEWWTGRFQDWKNGY